MKLIVSVVLLLAATPVAAADGVPITPAPGPARAIGGAANGCLAGGVAMPLSGPGWEVLRPERNRFWGHPALVGFLAETAGRTARLGRLLIGDMAQPRGGHMAYGHGSHQTGIDADILYRLADGPLTAEERARPAMDEVLMRGVPDPARWGTAQVNLLKVFALDPRVERIFVNAAVKRALCADAGADRAWLARLRPWWGHAEHFHVRLRCPAEDRDCLPGPPIPPGDGCGPELAWWFTPEATTPAAKPGPAKPRPPLPAACGAVMAAPDPGNRPAETPPAAGPRD
ncbi:MAG TPA: penicillin-insensitive murein endopeptidase [Rhodospirillaceae bacterium]|nr:penicillin-insensitive murein endopeptidase [Rhodospirillaceae bacterium]